MSSFYGETHRALQDQFQTRALADRIEEIAVKTEIVDDDAAFLESRDMFFLSTVDPQGRPSVSYKGGDPGFVKVVDPTTVAFPSYDGNGMFYSMGNIAATPQIGALFIDFETPHRLRLQGEASLHADDPLLAFYTEADLIVRVKLERIWVNCPRYIHRYARVAPSRYVPREAGATPLAAWKRVDAVQDVLNAGDRAKAQSLGLITIEQYFAMVAAGEG